MAYPLRHVPKPEARAALLSVVVSILLLAIKFVAYSLTGSTAIFSDALESIVNVLAAGFAMYALTVAHRPADAEHPYGHGKVEFLSAGIEGGMILLAALVIVARAIESLARGSGVEKLDVGLWLIVGAMVINGVVGWYLIRSGKAHDSATLRADGHHLLADAITSAAVLAGLIVVRLTHWPAADPITALIVAAYIGFIATRLMKSSSAGLMDEQDIEDERLLRQILDSHQGPSGKAPQICSYHKLRHRHSGRYHWVDFHIMVPARMTIDEGHKIASSIEYEIEQALGTGNATAHVEPCMDGECGTCNTNR